MDDFRALQNRERGYIAYHLSMMASGDCDPQYPALRYVAERMEINVEQRFWLAFLFSISYCVPTAVYMFNEFPDYENVDVRRLEDWWFKNKHKTLFQTDRAKVKNFDKVVPCFESYRSMMGRSQKRIWDSCVVPNNKAETYRRAFERMGQIYYFGRFTLFLFLESVHKLTGFPMMPDFLDLREAKSCRNGLCRAISRDDLIDKDLSPSEYSALQSRLEQLISKVSAAGKHFPVNIWNIETTLCAFKKLFLSKRYFGYYIDRQQEEIAIMERNVPHGVCWRLLWEFRASFFQARFLGEVNGWNGIRSGKMSEFATTGVIGNGMEFIVKPKIRAEINTDWNSYER